MKRTGEHFSGSVDQFLNHCSNLDLEVVQEQVNKQNYDSCIEHIKKHSECSEAEAIKLYDEFCLSEVKQTVDQLVEDGILQISEYNHNGEPLYVLTELGTKVHAELNATPKTPVKKPAKKPTVKKKK